MKNQEAVKLGRLRWAKKSKKERSAHGKMMRAMQLARKEVAEDGVDKGIDGLR